MIRIEEAGHLVRIPQNSVSVDCDDKSLTILCDGKSFYITCGDNELSNIPFNALYKLLNHFIKSEMDKKRKSKREQRKRNV